MSGGGRQLLCFPMSDYLDFPTAFAAPRPGQGRFMEEPGMSDIMASAARADDAMPFAGDHQRASASFDITDRRNDPSAIPAAPTIAALVAGIVKNLSVETD